MSFAMPDDQVQSALDAYKRLVQKRDELVVLVEHVSKTLGELKSQVIRLRNHVKPKTALEAVSLQRLADEYETAYKSVGKLWGYESGRLERVEAELREFSSTAGWSSTSAHAGNER